jgi:hypothetical protein
MQVCGSHLLLHPNVHLRRSGGVGSITRIERPSPSIVPLEGGLDWSPTARVQRGSSETARCTSTGDHLVCPLYSLQARSLSLQGWGLIDLPLRASNDINDPSKLARFSLKGWPGLVPNCARRTTTALSWGFREQGGLTRLPPLSVFFFFHPPTCEQHLLALR